MDNQLIASIYLNHKTYDIYGCWDRETPENKFDFYDVYDEDGFCINEGEHFYTYPTFEILQDYLSQIKI